ncbi:conserved hypothetical protein [Talaromyces marneffei ATCC 18224]|uniref:TNT domain-containing protein n=1 Tax=Talaromyces marneffei (strain ATCC 18224 / CBS 334.59 / QM 7333) TaxID=441960 RepID=B6QA17_TALMQ|nr:conserved hypothetical protein [Talaromyces marneffei ATCC 18224]
MILAIVIHLMLLVGGAFSESFTTSTTPITAPPPTTTRLGPTALPSDVLINSMLENYHQLGRECPQGYFDTFVNYTGANTYPPQQGFRLYPNGTQIFSRTTIYNNTLIDRFGGYNSTYVSPVDTPYEQRSIPPSNLVRRGENASIYYRFLTLRDIEVESGAIAPWYGQPGGGIQYILPDTTGVLVGNGWLQDVDSA